MLLNILLSQKKNGELMMIHDGSVVEQISCPLCESHDVSEKEIIAWQDIQDIYQSDFGFQIPNEVDEIKLVCCRSCDLRWFSPQVIGGEAFYEELQSFDWYYLSDKDEYKFAAQFIQKNDYVLEVGCGRGAFTGYINGASYKGLELSKAAVVMASNKGFDVSQQTIEDHAAYNQEAYSIVCAFQVLEHVSDVSAFIKGLIEVLKNDGLLILSVPSEDAIMGKLTNNVLNMPPHHALHWTDFCLKNLTKLYPLELVSIEHESLSISHSRDYAIAQVEKYYRHAFGISKKQIDRRFSCFLTKKILRVLSIPLEMYYKKTENKPWGHSVTVCLRKKKNNDV